jgi:uncharacterized membrane protein YbaN (DUF454 family)
MKKSVVKWGLNIAGMIFLLLGLIGIFLPLVPATPFFLLAGFCFSRSSPAIHRWLINHKYFGPPIKDWENRGAIRRSNKIIATLMLVISAMVVLPNTEIIIFGKIGFSLFITGILLFVWTRPS